MSALHPNTLGLDDALRAVRGNTTPNHLRHDGVMSRQSSAGSNRSAPSSGNGGGRASSASTATRGASHTDGYGQDSLSRPYHNSYGHGSHKNGRVHEHAREVAARAELQNKSLRNMTNSRSLFQQQLQQHQQLLVDQQHQSLHQFNSAIRQEIDNDPRMQRVVEENNEVEVGRSGSPSSVDSLEAEQKDSTSNGLHGSHSSAMLHSSINGGVCNSRSDTDILTNNSSASACNTSYASYTSYGSPSVHSMAPQTSNTTTTDLTSSTSSPNSFVLHRSASVSPSSNVAIVQPQPTNQPLGNGSTPTIDDRMFKPQSYPTTTAINSYHNQQHSYGNGGHEQLQLEDASEMVPDPIDHNMPNTLPVSSYKSDTYGSSSTPTNGYYSQPQQSVVTGHYGSHTHTPTSHDVTSYNMTNGTPSHNTTYETSRYISPYGTPSYNATYGTPSYNTTYGTTMYTSSHSVSGPTSNFSHMDVDYYKRSQIDEPARQKAWTTPSPVTNTNPAHSCSAPVSTTSTNSMTSNMSPYSSRTTATNMTVTSTYSSVTGSTVPSSFHQVAQTYTTNSHHSSGYNHAQYLGSADKAKAGPIQTTFHPSILHGYGQDDEQSEEEPEKEQENAEPKVIKGILKKTPMPAGRVMGVKGTCVGGNRGRTQSASSIRDSLEVARTQMISQQDTNEKVSAFSPIRYLLLGQIIQIIK